MGREPGTHGFEHLLCECEKKRRVGPQLHSFVSQLYTKPSVHVSIGWNSRKINSRPSYLSRDEKQNIHGTHPFLSLPWETNREDTAANNNYY
jgi:hypothetical protein